MKIQHSGSVLTIDGNPFALDHRILDAASDGERVFVIYDYMAYPSDAPALNLVSLDRDANLIWTVKDNPVDTPDAGYTCIDGVSPLKVGNFAGYQCLIDPDNGDLLNSHFTK